MNKKLTVLAVLAAMILSCTFAFADTFEEVMKKAEAGDAKAQLDIAIAYFHGDYVKENHEEGAKWMLKAAENGLAKAQFGAGLMYENGEGVKQSHEEAAKWYLKAAEQGYAEAQCNIGVCYTLGRGVEQNLDEGFKWLKKAEAQGDPNAKKVLEKEFEILRHNARNGDKDAQEALTHFGEKW